MSEAAGPKITVGEEWVCGLDDKRVVVARVYETEIHATWADGLQSAFPRDFFVDLFYPAALEAP